jgi:phosphoribosyl-AMP cyclohydrolase / phosphoribosyl-ATP pyrophosphohydrolase
MIIPSIDLMNSKAVQLRQGKDKVLERDNVLELAKEFSTYGDIAVIDLDSALFIGDNLNLIKKICKIAKCRVGGGIRSIEKAKKILGYGADKIIIGTKANTDFLKNFPRERIIVAIDTKDGKIVNEGWRRKTEKTPEEIIKKLENYCSEFLFTNVNLEGMMNGIDLDIIKKIKSITSNKITIAGGITTSEDVRLIESMNMNSQIGMALYTDKIKLPECFSDLIDFDKNNGLVPTIVQDEYGQVLMLAYSNKESLLKSFNEKKASYYSRSRKNIWTKGEKSKNYQLLLSARYDCDRDTILFRVKQKNFACHTKTYSCFGDKNFSFKNFYDRIHNRKIKIKKNSYTQKLFDNPRFLNEKIREESNEVINYTDRDNLVWEIADLSYFITVLMVREGIKPDEIINELRKRI